MKLASTLIASSCILLTACGGQNKDAANPPTALLATVVAVPEPSNATTVSADAANLNYVISYTGTPSWVRVYIDADKAASSGYPMNGMGTDYFIENGTLYRYSGSNGAWAWTRVKTVSSVAGASSATVTLAKSDIGSPASIDSMTQTDPPIVMSPKITTALSGTTPPPATSTTVSVDASNINYVIPYASKPTWTRVFIDTDRATTSGFVNNGIGADYLIENGALFRYAGSNGGWGWTRIKSVSSTLGATAATVSVAKADIGAPPAIDSITQTDPPNKISPKLTTNTSTTTPPPVTPPPVTPPPTTGPIGIDLFGDSTTHGDIGGTPYQVAQTPSMVMDANLPTNFVVKNEGVGGASIAELLAGRDGVHAPWETTVARSTAKYIILDYAINDSYEPGTTTTTFKASYARAIDVARANGKFVIVQTSNPTNDNQRTVNFANAVKQVAAEKNVPVIDQYTYLSQHMAANNLGVYQITNDGVHPTQATYILEGQYAAKRFKEIVGIK